jgi:hypothetical protein
MNNSFQFKKEESIVDKPYLPAGPKRNRLKPQAILNPFLKWAGAKTK